MADKTATETGETYSGEFYCVVKVEPRGPVGGRRKVSERGSP